MRTNDALMTSSREAILMVSPDNAFTQSLQKALGDNGYAVTLAPNETAGVTAIRDHPPTVVLVNRLAANPATLRRHASLRTVSIVSFYQPGLLYQEDDCVADLDSGSDISVGNESVRQLLARTRAILRRAQYAHVRCSQYEVNEIRLDLDRHEVHVRNRLVELTPKEFNILLQIVRSPNRVFTRQELLNSVWGEDYALEEHAVDVHIHSLRQKIEADPSQPAHIVTVRRIGFKFRSR